LFSGATDPQKWNDVSFLLAPMAELPFYDQITLEAARIFQHLRKNGKMIEFRDIFIAATAIVNNLPLITLNVKDFSRISGLALI
jgi:predicted nucleic acid-binding protein